MEPLPSKLKVRVRRNLVAVLASCTALLSGCGAKDPRVEVSGTVLFRSAPLKKGSIQFEPLDRGATVSGAVIEDGRYHIPKSQGLAPGKYRVRIYAAMEAGSSDEAPAGKTGGQKLTPDLIPPQYNEDTKLTAEVNDGGPNVIPFDLK